MLCIHQRKLKDTLWGPVFKHAKINNAKIKSHDLTDKLQPYTIKQGNVTLYSEEGQNLIKQAFKLNQDNEILQTVKDKMTEIQICQKAH